MEKKTNNNEIIQLMKDVELKLGFSIKTPKHFEMCRTKVLEQTQNNISTSTLKRMWGYVSVRNKYTPSQFILNTLSRFVGFYDFGDYKHCLEKGVCDDNINSLMLRITMHMQMLNKEIEQMRMLLHKKN